MKKIIVTIAIIAFPLIMLAQSPLDNLFDKYSGREGYTTVSIGQSMFELFSSVANDKDDKDFKDITSRLSSIKILSCECKTGAKSGQDFYKEVTRALPSSEYQSLMDINDGGDNVKFMIRKHGDKISELIMVAGGKDPCVMSLQGDIDLKQISKLSKTMNIKGLDRLNNVGPKTK